MERRRHWSDRNPRRNPITVEWLKNQTTTDSNGCWIWKRDPGKGRYPSVGGNNWKLIRVSRLIWALIHGYIPDGLFVLHTCDVTRCINPDHLYLGTQTQNVHDAITRGRAPWSRLTEQDVNIIRSSTKPRRALSEMFNVSLETIGQIIRRVTWKHI